MRSRANGGTSLPVDVRDALGLGHQPLRARQIASPRSLQRQRLKVDGQLGECARFAHELGLSLVHRDRFVMPHRCSHTADMPTPPHDVLDRQLHHFVGSAPKDRHRGHVPVGNQEGEGFDHQIEWMRVGRQRREGSDRPGHLDEGCRLRRDGAL